jgi:hypothetical protein
MCVRLSLYQRKSIFDLFTSYSHSLLLQINAYFLLIDEIYEQIEIEEDRNINGKRVDIIQKW